MKEAPALATPTVRKIVAITGGELVPSRRFRVKAIVPHFLEHGFQMDELCARVSSYPPSRRWLRPAWFAAALAERMTYVFRAQKYDAVILQRELISTFATVEHLIRGPRIFDVDDAIYRYRGGKAARRIAAQSELVVCGNDHLADAFSQWNSNIAVIPTGVDTVRLRPTDRLDDDGIVTIGWIGTISNFRYLEEIKPVLGRVLKSHRGSRFRLVSSECPDFLRELGGQLEFVQWVPGIEETVIPTFSIGIMPLADDEWTRGKCAFKMLQYMAAGVPVVASDVGMNSALLRQADIGIGINAPGQWADALGSLIADATTRRRLGAGGRNLAVSGYSLNRIAALWKEQLDKVL